MWCCFVVVLSQNVVVVVVVALFAFSMCLLHFMVIFPFLHICFALLARCLVLMCLGCSYYYATIANQTPGDQQASIFLFGWWSACLPVPGLLIIVIVNNKTRHRETSRPPFFSLAGGLLVSPCLAC